ncbi:MAG: CpsD/CapB family tyrosine-protein kinase [Planctomycetes bacterium]|nr:CpsD/CapB family tyrosine-protein kinase [Planctomycetota bacterium]
MRNLIKKADSKSRRAEIIATELGYLWTHLLQRGAGDSHRSIGFVAIGDDEGSNTLAANLALFLGSKGMRVALAEASLRTRALASVFGATPNPGLAEVLTGQAVIRDALRQEVAPGVDLLPAGETADPFWAFTGDNLRKIIQQTLAERDLCLVDVPPLNRAPEASFVVRSLDAVVLVVEANRHDRDVVQRNLKMLRSLGTPVLGSVVNELVHEVPTLVGKML